MRSEQITDRSQRFWYRFCLICLSLYIAYVIWLCRSPLFDGKMLLAIGIYLAVTLALCFVLHIISGIELPLVRSKKNERGKYLLIIVSLATSLIIFGVCLAACWPGAVNYDASNQWHQAHTGEYNNWHPLFHTLLVRILVMICDKYSFCVLVQITVFSLAQAYLNIVLYRNGIPVWLILIVHMIVCLTSSVNGTLMYLGKDSAMTIGVLFLCAQCCEMLRTKGEWIKRPANGIAFSAALACTTLVRHNAIFFTIPTSVIVFCVFSSQRRRILALFVLALVCIGAFKGPVSSVVDVVYPHNTLEESIGIPMTVLADCYVQHPEQVDEETKKFLNTLASDEEWNKTYMLHNYNSIKFTFDRELIASKDAFQMLGMAFRTACKQPETAFESVNALTDLVWDITGKNEGTVSAGNSGDIGSAAYGNGLVKSIGEKLKNLIKLPENSRIWCWLTQNIGVQMTILLICTLAALRRKSTGALILGFPVLVYNLGTMLLLCGNDVRFFQYSQTVCLPLSIWLLYWEKE